ncbi:cyclohexanecarboxylate-CoA ligase [Comamonas terrigena]|uniref:cyclohexanecarboxylate-CoA ligase n=1 Tax=Comamonas terrigena TaxID=32013 RepID=UPI00244C16FD|nr:cyclohexanecarboxylate-CoA ligase [Comamonas terrigena]MDH0050584.1 cyclohexanecarboxylate-CoA ligase [Comamonas terrigena]MDH0513080.1 cyclohexanecarboxylate-CoA ligase [Comamonas terrigena]MDH1092443.1 cyclohexanecarboxylate-CoA ligase [Comamonas terrigena]MDH1502540.1 cyclohexanecarboxylate-CoA ligase [Comamonas terrigena]
MEFDAVLIPPRRARNLQAGHWRDQTINDALDQAVRERPQQLALTAWRTEDDAVRRFSYAELARMADRMAVGLHRLGVRRNDVVACQLPNWWQFTLLYLASARIGAVLNPLMPIFRERELRFMLQHGEAKVMVVPQRFRNFDHAAMLRQLRPELPQLQHLLVVGGTSAESFEAALTEPAWEDAGDAAAILHATRPTADDVTQLMYTSGTTGEPKGVMHTANTVSANIWAYAERLHLGADDVVLMASPMAHQTGFLYGLMMPVMLGARVVLQDLWEPAKAAQIIRDEGVSFTMASTPFLSDLARVVAESGQPVPTLKTFLCAGAPIPGPLVEQARSALGAKIVSAWGMTENGAVTLIRPEDADERAVHTDGLPLPGVEIKVVDIDGRSLPAGTAGQLWLRACSNFGGYLKRPHLNGTDAEDWFDTGDQARIDAQGYLRITGRSKDVIIRGGENIPVLEVETLLYKHPAVLQAAVVGFPDARLGERACAFVVTRPGQQLGFDDMVAYFKAQQLTTQYIPERLEVLPAMPATPSGKIQKFRLREQLVALLSPSA